MGKAPSLYVKDYEKVDDYQRFRNARSYLDRKSDPEIRFCGNREDREEIIRLSCETGYKNVVKFDKLRQKWHLFKKKIPRSYVDVIGAYRYVLEAARELDQEEAMQAAELPRFPECAVLRISESFYRRIELPEKIDEDEAIEFLRGCAKKAEKTCIINYGQLMSVYVHPNQRVEKVIYSPGLIIRDDYLTPTIFNVSGGVLIPK